MKLLTTTDKNQELLITKLTRPVSFWLVLIVFIILLFLNSFGLIHTEDLYLQILKEVLITMTAFYFTIRGIEKIANYKYNINNTNNTNNNVDQIKLNDNNFPELNDEIK